MTFGGGEVDEAALGQDEYPAVVPEGVLIDVIADVAAELFGDFFEAG